LSYLCINKIVEVYKLVCLGKVFFLSRPRRFGKSLLSTIRYLFEGEKDCVDVLRDVVVEENEKYSQEMVVVIDEYGYDGVGER